METRKVQSGFTLIEGVIVIALFAVLGIVMVSMFISQNRLHKTETANFNITFESRTALDDIDNWIRTANQTLVSHGIYNGGAQTLILQVQSVNNSEQLIAGTFDYVVYYLSNNDLMREVIPNISSIRTAGLKKIASNVSNLVFTYDDVDFAQVTKVDTSLTLTESVGFQNRTITQNSSAVLRNH